MPVRRGSLTERRNQHTRWVRRDDTPCLKPATLGLLDEIARRAEAREVDWLRIVSRVNAALPA